MIADTRALLQRLHAEAVTQVGEADAALQGLLHEREGSHDDDEHDPEGVTLSSEWSRLAGLAEAAAAKLQQVDDALVRLDAGDYGACLSCGRRIPAARLEVRPFAEYCVSCAEKLGR